MRRLIMDLVRIVIFVAEYSTIPTTIHKILTTTLGAILRAQSPTIEIRVQPFSPKEGVRTVFEELMPLLTQRMLVVTLSRVSDEHMCANVIPKQLKSDQRDDGAALSTPLSVTGTPKELDEQLPRQLVEFVETHLGLSSTLKIAKEQMDAAAKAAREAAKKSTASKSHAGSSRSTDEPQSNAEPTQATATDAVGAGTSTGSLFDLEPKNDK